MGADAQKSRGPAGASTMLSTALVFIGLASARDGMGVF